MKNTIRSYVRHSILVFWCVFWEIKTILFRKKNEIRIILLHQIKPEEEIIFKKIILSLQKKGQFISPDEFLMMTSGEKEIIGLNYLITFDDGCGSNFKSIKSVLDPLDIKSVSFLPSDLFCKEDNLSEENSRKFFANQVYEGEFFTAEEVPLEILPLSISQIKDMVSNGHEIGSHSKSHSRFATMKNTEKIKDEIIGSKNDLKILINKNIRMFAYPFGDINSWSDVSDKIAKENYKAVFSGVRGMRNADSKEHIFFRQTIDLNLGAFICSSIINGCLDFLYYKERNILKSWESHNAR